MEGTVKFRNLDKVRFIIQDATSLDVGYAYEDLVFSEHGLFIIKFNDDNDNILYSYFNKDCLAAKQKQLQADLTHVAELNGIKLYYKGKFEMNSIEGKEEFELKFLDM